jgi:hypothetical protein
VGGYNCIGVGRGWGDKDLLQSIFDQKCWNSEDFTKIVWGVKVPPGSDRETLQQVTSIFGAKQTLLRNSFYSQTIRLWFHRDSWAVRSGNDAIYLAESTKSIIEKCPCEDEFDSVIICAEVDVGAPAVFDCPCSCAASRQGVLMLPFASFVPYPDVITARFFDYPALEVIVDVRKVMESSGDGKRQGTPSTCS